MDDVSLLDILDFNRKNFVVQKAIVIRKTIFNRKFSSLS